MVSLMTLIWNTVSNSTSKTYEPLQISDMVLVLDPEFKKYVELYSKDEDAFFKDFAKAFAKLLELGVPFPASKPWYQFW